MPFLCGSRDPHSHNFYEIMVVIGGAAIHHIDKFHQTISMGDVYIIKPGQPHSYEVEGSGGIEVVNILFGDELLRADLRDLDQLPGFQTLFCNQSKRTLSPHLRLPPQELAHVISLVEQIEIELEDMTTGYELFCETKFRELLLLISRRYSHVQGRVNSNVIRMSELIAYMEKHLGEDISFNMLAKVSKMSPTSLRRICQAAFGCSPMDYLRKLRVNKAMLLLADTSKSVSDVAFEVGFQDAGYFSRIFKAESGKTPREFKQGW
jgi:AraC-like DNA-binding protein